jgi:hypothetical protein
MEKEFLPYEIALAMKGLEFDEPCLARFDGGGFRMLPVYDPLKNSEIKESWFCAAPLYQQCWRWFREKCNLHSTIIITSMQNYGYLIEEPQVPYHIDQLISYKTYEEAELECLKKLIEICKNK